MTIYRKDISDQNGTAVFTVRERPVHGSERLGSYAYHDTLYPSQSGPPSDGFTALHRGHRRYELKNHPSSSLRTGLGNMMTVLAGHKAPVSAQGTDPRYRALSVAAYGYSPFGAPLEGRGFEGDGYRYGFNGMERDDEIKGSGNSYTTHFRQYEPRLGKWLSVDPLFIEFPSTSPYGGLKNNPLSYIDQLGDSTIFVNESGETIADTDDGSTDIYVINQNEEENFIGDLQDNVSMKKDLDPEVNENLGERYGTKIEDLPDEVTLSGAGSNLAYRVGYNSSYTGQRTPGSIPPQFQTGTGGAYGLGVGIGKKMRGREK